MSTTPTVRRYPRTLDDAFRGPRYADPIERPAHHYSPLCGWAWLAGGVLATAIGIVIAFAIADLVDPEGLGGTTVEQTK